MKRQVTAFAGGVLKVPTNSKAFRLGAVVPSVAVLAALAGSTAPAIASSNNGILSADAAAGSSVSRSTQRADLLDESSNVTTEAAASWSLSDNSSNASVPYSPTKNEQEARTNLQNLVNTATSVYNSSSRAEASKRTTLKGAIDNASSKLADTHTGTDDLNSAGTALSDAANDVRDSQSAAVAAANAATEQRTASRRAAANTNRAAAAAPVSAPSVPVAVTGNGSGAQVAQLASSYAGKAPYRWGGTTPSGWDCSGMVMWVYARFGVSLPHSSGAQARMGTAVPSLAQAQPGDILANGTHAAIYVGNGMIINALNPSQGTKITPVSWGFHSGYSIRRIFN
ncbi:C40 family peptidase [Scardovia wiggsiae]|uniref:C40 family peptidase n=1 Tax=Scardovia wiggsiae TaxID=230143 RepID=UPI00374F4523